MRIRSIVAIIVIVGAFVAAAASPASAAASGRITNGTKVDRSGFQARWSSIVSVRPKGGSGGFSAGWAAGFDRSFHTCGGVLIAPRIVLTAAHCVASGYVPGIASDYQVLGGTRRLGTSRRDFGDLVDVVSVVVHPSYRAGTYFSDRPRGLDLAILELGGRVRGAGSLPVVADGDVAAWGNGRGLARGARVAGWGVTVANANVAPTSLEEYREQVAPAELREAELPILPDRICESTDSAMGADAAAFDRETMLCAGTRDRTAGAESNRIGACNGDSGGPLIVPAASGFVVAGIVSWGPSASGGCNRPSVFARVDAARAWIEDVARRLDSGAGDGTPTDVTVTRAKGRSAAVTWRAPSGSAVISRYRVLTQTSLYELYGSSRLPERYRRMLSAVKLRIERAATGGESTAVHVRDIAPIRPGSNVTRAFRVEAIDEDGIARLSKIVRFVPSRDAHRPELTERLRVVSHRRGVPTLFWPHATDDDCVERYERQYRRAGERTWRIEDIHEDSTCTTEGRSGWHEYWGDRFDAPNRWTMFDMRAGTYAVRIVAVDRAGNRSATRPRPVRIHRYVEDIGLDEECDRRGDRIVCVYPVEDEDES